MKYIDIDQNNFNYYLNNHTKYTQTFKFTCIKCNQNSQSMGISFLRNHILYVENVEKSSHGLKNLKKKSNKKV